MKPEVKSIDESEEFFIPEGCHILEISNSPDDPALSVARARVLPEVTTQWHLLRDTEERYYILSGEGEVEVGDLSPQHVTNGDMILIPAGCRQRITNCGNDDLVFLALCTPRFRPECYEALE